MHRMFNCDLKKKEKVTLLIPSSITLRISIKI